MTVSPEQLANDPEQPTDSPGQHHWHVLGAGAMGCLWAARLAESFIQTGHTPNVTLILRDNDALASFTGQVVVESAQGEATPFNLKATSAAQLNYPVSNLLVTTKAFDTEEALRSVLPWLDHNSTICLLQNGIRNHLALQNMTGIRVLSMTTSHGAWLKHRFHVVHAGSGQTFFGPLQTVNPEYSRHLSRSTFPAALTKSMNLKHTEDMEKRLWQKFAANCVINGLTVIHDCQNGALLTRPSAHQDLVSLCSETETVLTQTDRLNMALYPYVRKILLATATNWSSTWQDVQAGRITEIEEFNGYLCELAARANLPCPHNQAVLRSITNHHAVIR
ncbi:putative 2-dehydropantoate 2-reductase [Pseudohongiella nitratireducens]|uniref:2-dehydropantoate 2-reductase n=1 Tax=Pseudohongiella nitratireducens TaxID=1768907 RepID=A0A916VJN1_9GAMM|nr:2-dehydropantoate 2-reductase [Pseudohongiella nitratireducens]MDF1623028.1 2-dehydropantoate 2-reductase [Pseudohongiella nitratireducens]GFZ78986.1 putative 2-dehydropantoate 2-reductase [Pseudohongiella nitratireducens]